jgi:RimJ/RimL family protein N-acetyltransferase
MVLNMTYLETSRIRLEDFDSTDAHLLKDLDSDPEVMLYLNGGRPSTNEEVETALERTLALKEKHSGKFGLWKAFEKASGDFIGWFLFRPDKKDPDNVKSIEIGYRLKKKYWGKGFATEVSKALMVKGFAELGVETIWARTLLVNTKSQNVMKKINLKFEQHFEEIEFEGADKRGVRYSLNNDEWLRITIS